MGELEIYPFGRVSANAEGNEAVILMEAFSQLKTIKKNMILNSHISQISQSFLSKNVTFLRSGNHTNIIRVT